MATAAKEWFIGRDGKQYGPYSDRVIRLAAAHGKLRAQDLVWAQGMEGWARAEAVPDFAPLVRAPVPAKPPLEAEPSAAPSSNPVVPANAPAANPVIRTNYFVRHWHGDFSLARAYWVNNFGVNMFWAAATAALTASGIAQKFGIRITGLWILALLSASAVVSIWSAVGVWHSAQAHTARGGHAIWAGLAMLLVAMGLLRLIGTGITQAPLVAQSIDFVLGRDSSPAAVLRVVNRATEVEIAGGLSFGTADRLKTILDATPTVHLVQLNNVGGWIQEGQKLGALVAERKLATYTARECDSACLLIFMAGEDRLLGSHAKLGFHQASVSGVGGEVAKEGSDIIRASLERRGVPEPFISHALSTPPSSVWYPSTKELMAAHVITAVVDDRTFGETGIAGWRNRATLERDFDSVPLFSALATAEPDIYQQLKTRYVADVEAGVPQNEMVGRVHSVLVSEIAPKYLQHGPDAALMSYWQTQVVEMRELRAIDPNDCVAFLFPTPKDTLRAARLLSSTAVRDEYARMAALVTATAEAQATAPPLAQIQTSLLKVARRTEQAVPGGMALISKASRTSPQPKQLCDATLDFYAETLALPPNEAGPLLRYLAASN